MPLAAAKLCSHPGCWRINCSLHTAKQRKRQQDAQRGSRQSRGYTDFYVHYWRPLVLRKRPVCESIERCMKPADELHHIIRLADGGEACDEANVQALCSFHHEKLGSKGGRG